MKTVQELVEHLSRVPANASVGLSTPDGIGGWDLSSVRYDADDHYVILEAKGK